jgi:putative ABC transport system substrate-binding protein
MNRRAFVIGLGAVLAAPFAAEAQEPGKIPRIRVMHEIPAALVFQALRKGLAELGYVEGQHVHLEYRWSKDAGSLAVQMVQSRFDVIVPMTSGAARAVKQATDIVPIVFCSVGEDPVRRGWISSFARPGGNATGTVTLAVELESKRLFGRIR